MISEFIYNIEADLILRFAKIFDENMTRHIEVQKEDFHAAIFKSVLDGFQIPVAAYATLEKILTTIGDNVTLAETKTQEKHQYWLMLTRYDWTAQTQTTQTGECRDLR